MTGSQNQSQNKIKLKPTITNDVNQLKGLLFTLEEDRDRCVYKSTVLYVYITIIITVISPIGIIILNVFITYYQHYSYSCYYYFLIIIIIILCHRSHYHYHLYPCLSKVNDHDLPLSSVFINTCRVSNQQRSMNTIPSHILSLTSREYEHLALINAHFQTAFLQTELTSCMFMCIKFVRLKSE